MPLPAEHLQKKPAPLSSSEDAAEKEKFIGETRVFAKIRGLDLNDPHIKAVFAEMRDQLTVTPRLGPKHDIKYSGRDGIYKNADDAAASVARQAAEIALLSSYGPAPEAILTDVLETAGLTKTEAHELAAGRVRRLEDGRVGAFVNGSEFIPAPTPLRDREYTPEELAAIRDPRRAVEIAARAILAERNGERAMNTRTDEDRLRIATTVGGMF